MLVPKLYVAGGNKQSDLRKQPILSKSSVPLRGPPVYHDYFWLDPSSDE